MIKYLTHFAFLLVLLPALALAQANITFQWDPSETVGPPENPVKYRLCYTTVQPPVGTVPTERQIFEAGTALQFLVPSLGAGTYYFFATAYQYILVDGTASGPIVESGPSNVLRVQVFVPPGNPKNTRVRVVTVAKSESGAELGYRVGD